LFIGIERFFIDHQMEFIEKRGIGRPKLDRTSCKKCGQTKELMKGRICCKDCWNSYYKNYYSNKVEYADKKRNYQREYQRAKLQSNADG
jgi:hypothetical protein